MGVRLMSEGQVCPGVTKVGGSQEWVHGPASGVLSPRGPLWVSEQVASSFGSRGEPQAQEI